MGSTSSSSTSEQVYLPTVLFCIVHLQVAENSYHFFLFLFPHIWGLRCPVLPKVSILLASIELCVSVCVCVCVCVCVEGERKRESTIEEHNENEICYRPNFIVHMLKGLVPKLVTVCKSTVTILSRGNIHSLWPVFVTFVGNAQENLLIELKAI